MLEMELPKLEPLGNKITGEGLEVAGVRQHVRVFVSDGMKSEKTRTGRAVQSFGQLECALLLYFVLCRTACI